MTSSSTVVVVHAHPDDEAIFTGATMYRLAEAGARVVLLTATGGEEGRPRVPLCRGETLQQRRRAELERACELLGVQRLVVLGFRDSGAHPGPYRAGALGAACASELARQVARVVEAEGAQTLVHYDRRGIYGHVDHVRVHQAGNRVVRRLGLTGYEATVDAERLGRGPRHVLHAAAGEQASVGVSAAEISVAVRATPPALLAKMAAMSAHASQIGPEFLDPVTFEGGYGCEWFVRRGAPGLLEDQLLTEGSLPVMS